jgi:hypothetical protein
MFETEDLLLTYRLMLLPQGASCPDANSQSVERLPDHRTLYLDYEGPISRDRGSVRKIARGEYYIDQCVENRVRVKLASPELTAVVEFLNCEVGEATQLYFLDWNWHAS